MVGSNNSLNNFISKAGGKLSFGNKFRRARQPGGANFHTGYYYGPPEYSPGSGDSKASNSITDDGVLIQREYSEEYDFRRSHYLESRDIESQTSGKSKDGISGLLKPTPQENEDPVYFGFEIVIDDKNSPLLNGEIDDFFSKFSSIDEIRGRQSIYNGSKFDFNNQFSSEPTILSSNRDHFVFQMQRLFKFKGEISAAASLSPNRRRYYIKKIEGLDKLIERNASLKSNSFVKFREDVLKVSFYEDVGLSTGYFINLYKILYWSRLRGKGVVPENLLRFDCQIIVSEIRNYARVVEALDEIEDTVLDQDRVSTNKKKIDRLQKKDEKRRGLNNRQKKKKNRLNQEIEDLTIKNNLKTIEENVSRYVYNVYECQFHFDKMTHPSDINLEEGPGAQTNTSIDISFKFSDMVYEKYEFTNGGWSVDRIKNARLDPRGIESNDADTNLDTSSGSIKPFKTLPKTLNLLKSNFKRTPPPDSPLASLGKNLKKALLSEGQRRLNDQFRLLNNAIDKVRDSFGIGRMSDPRNVYDVPRNGGRFWFDVKNSLRNFTGDFLSQTLFGR